MIKWFTIEKTLSITALWRLDDAFTHLLGLSVYLQREWSELNKVKWPQVFSHKTTKLHFNCTILPFLQMLLVINSVAMNLQYKALSRHWDFPHYPYQDLSFGSCSLGRRPCAQPISAGYNRDVPMRCSWHDRSLKISIFSTTILTLLCIALSSLLLLWAKHEQRKKNATKWDPGLAATPGSGLSLVALIWCPYRETLCQKSYGL